MIPKETIQEFHEQMFGEELARVNFLPKEERWAYVRALWQRAHDRAQRGDGPTTPHGAERIWDAEPDPIQS